MVRMSSNELSPFLCMKYQRKHNITLLVSATLFRHIWTYMKNDWSSARTTWYYLILFELNRFQYIHIYICFSVFIYFFVSVYIHILDFSYRVHSKKSYLHVSEIDTNQTIILPNKCKDIPQIETFWPQIHDLNINQKQTDEQINGK